MNIECSKNELVTSLGDVQKQEPNFILPIMPKMPTNHLPGSTQDAKKNSALTTSTKRPLWLLPNSAKMELL